MKTCWTATAQDDTHWDTSTHCWQSSVIIAEIIYCVLACVLFLSAGRRQGGPVWPGELVAGNTESRCHTAVWFHILSLEGRVLHWLLCQAAHTHLKWFISSCRFSRFSVNGFYCVVLSHCLFLSVLSTRNKCVHLHYSPSSPYVPYSTFMAIMYKTN